MLLFIWFLLDFVRVQQCLAKLTASTPTQVNFTQYHELENIPTQHGAIAERWDDIDSTNIQFLLDDPRYPQLPTMILVASAFAEPRDWGESFGSRVYAWFETSMTGYHTFHVATDAQTQVSISKSGNPKDKILICGVSASVFEGWLDYGTRPEQVSVPIYLKKDQLYYLESLHKEMYEIDLMEVAVTLPDNSSYAPIPARFLWTGVPTLEQRNATAAKHIMHLAASWGARWGAKFGALEAKQSGKQAGALAGKEAGAEAGAKAGAAAAAVAAQRVATKYLSQVLTVVNGQIAGNIFNIYANCTRRGTMHSKREDILREAFCNVQRDILLENVDTKATKRSRIAEVSSSVSGEPTRDYTEAENELALWKKVLRWVKREERNAKKESESKIRSADMESSRETTSWRNAEIREREELQKALLDFQQKEAAKNLKVEEADAVSPTKQAISEITVKPEVKSRRKLMWKQGLSSQLTRKVQHPIIEEVNARTSWTKLRTIADGRSPLHFNSLDSKQTKAAKTGKTSAGTYTEVPSEYVSYSVWPGPGTDPDALARTLTTISGAAEKLVHGAKYVIHSRDVPSPYQHFSKNLGWRATESKLIETRYSQFFIAHTPRRKPFKRKEAITISFESACQPGYFIAQKNYGFVLQKREFANNKTVFDLDTSFFAYRAVSRPETFSFGLTLRVGWFVAETKKHTMYDSGVQVREYGVSEEFLIRSSFVLEPIRVGEDPLMNCIGVLKVPESPRYPPGDVKEQSRLVPPCPENCCNCKQPERPSSGLAGIRPTMASLKPPEGQCLAVTFVNDVGNPFKITSSLKPEGYVVNTKALKIKIRTGASPQQRKVVFRAVDLLGHHKLYINHANSYITVFREYCSEYKQVLVSRTKMVIT